MKKKSLSIVLFMGLSLGLTSCGTLFTSSSQEITFTGESGVGIYDHSRKLAEIGEGGTATAKVRKRLSSQTLVAKKEGYKNTPVKLEATFNPISILNLLDPIAWAIDLGTGKCCKWGDDIIDVQMEKK